MGWIAPKKGYGLDSPKERIWAGQPQKNMGWIDPKEYGLQRNGLDNPHQKNMGWIAPKKGYGLDSPHQQKYGLDRLDSPKERIWADSPKEDVDSPKDWG